MYASDPISYASDRYLAIAWTVVTHPAFVLLAVALWSSFAVWLLATGSLKRLAGSLCTAALYGVTGLALLSTVLDLVYGQSVAVDLVVVTVLVARFNVHVLHGMRLR